MPMGNPSDPNNKTPTGIGSALPLTKDAAEIIRDLALAVVTPQTVSLDQFNDAAPTHHGYRLPNGELKIADVSAYMKSPRFLSGVPSFDDMESFCEYVNDFKIEGTRIFFDKNTSTFTAVFDYQTKDLPKWGRNNATLRLQFSEQWNLWLERNGRYFSQEEFGEFLQENDIDVIDPNSADLLEASMDFAANKSTTFREATRLRDGTVRFEFNEELKPTSAIVLPQTIKLSIPVFYNEQLQPVNLRLRYKIDGQRLKLAYEFIRSKRTIDEAAAVIVNQVSVTTGTTVHLGRRV